MEEKKLKCVGVADLHGTLPKDLPPGDVLCICGDISPLDIQEDTVSMVSWFCLEFLPWVEKSPYKKVLLVAGNHDFFLENIHKREKQSLFPPYGIEYTWRSGSDVMKKLLPGNLKSKFGKLVYLCDSSFKYEGKRFYGTPWCTNLQRWAFYKNTEDIKEAYNRIPKICDVILTHQPPQIEGLGQVIQSGNWNYGQDFGSPELAEVLNTRNFKYALCGHVHSGQHYPVVIGDKHLANVSIKNEDYDYSYYPFEFEV